MNHIHNNKLMNMKKKFFHVFPLFSFGLLCVPLYEIQVKTSDNVSLFSHVLSIKAIICHEIIHLN